jgi:tetratricopeptide (TPR) repeat protein
MKKVISFLLLVFNFFFSFSQIDIDWFIKAKLAEEKKNNDSAIYFLTQAINIKPESLYLSERAELFLKCKKINQALADYKAAEEKGPEIIKYKIARCYALIDSINETSVYLKKYLSGIDKIPENIVRTDSVFTKIKNTPAWESIWKTNWYNAYEDYLGDLYYLSSKEKNTELFDVIDSALNHYPEKAELWLWRAKAYTFGNNPKEAMRSLDMALKLDPARVDVMILRAEILRKEGKSKKAIADYNSILISQPWNIKYLKERGISKIEAGDYKSAVDDLVLYYKYDTLNMQSLYYAGHACYLSGDLKNAIYYFSASLKINNGMAECYFERGRCYLDQLDYDNAFSDFCMAIDLNNGKGEFFYYRGLTYYGKKNKIGACHDWEKARSLNYLEAEQYMLRLCGTE